MKVKGKSGSKKASYRMANGLPRCAVNDFEGDKFFAALESDKSLNGKDLDKVIKVAHSVTEKWDATRAKRRLLPTSQATCFQAGIETR